MFDMKSVHLYALLLACLLMPPVHAAATPLQPGGERDFTATIYDQFGHEIDPAGYTFAWTATGGTLDGSTDAVIRYSASLDRGAYLLAVSVAGLEDSLDLIIGGLRRIRLLDLPSHVWEHDGGAIAEITDGRSVFHELGEKVDNTLRPVGTGDG
ncbi:MAG: hypothetical protein ACOCXJ_01225 [Planctomycetota bacterium]